MKKLCYFVSIAAMAWAMQACNNTSRATDDSVDAANEVNDSLSNNEMMADKDDADFAVKAADGGLAEVSAGQLAVKKASNQDVNDFGQMMIDDHSKANEELKALASQKGITLPTATSDEKTNDLQKLSEKTGADFDKAFMDQMVKDHKKTIDLFEKAEKNAKDADIRAFAQKTLPTLRSHLDRAQQLQDQLK